MAKNILIFSDGTGQMGGLKPDQRLSNVYKIYRAARPSPDNCISPSDQVAFYDAGLGVTESGGNYYRRLMTAFDGAFGTGISKNIVDCYEAILRHYEEGDRVYLFGFSRGAYTVRCVANVLNLCGVPTHDEKKQPIPRYGKALRAIAEMAVTNVYEHGSGKDRGDYEEEREEQAQRFRNIHGSNGVGMDGESQGNVAPYFIGVFDTVASLGSVIAMRVILAVLVLSIGLSVAAHVWLNQFWTIAFAIPTIFILFRLIYIRANQRKSVTNYPVKGQSRNHYAAWRLKNYDRFLDTNVDFARHARSIDEDRKKFPIVGWGNATDVKRKAGQKPAWLDQVWFAGNHSDIGGSYPEAESRLSDIALSWMLSELDTVPHPILLNSNAIQVYPDHRAVQHDEVKGLFESWPNWIPKFARITWKRQSRTIHPEAKLHSSVLDRFEESNVGIFDKVEPYRPANLSPHKLVSKYYIEK